MALPSHVLVLGSGPFELTPARLGSSLRRLQWLTRARSGEHLADLIVMRYVEVLLPMREGSIGASAILREMGELVLGAVKGRTGPDDITLFKSPGLAVADAAAADRVVRNGAG